MIYGALVFWAFICLFPIYWTMTTSFKSAVDVTQGHLIPWVDFMPDWKGWRSLGLSPDTIFETSTVRDEFLKRFMNSVITSVGASLLAVIIGSLAAYGLTPLPLQIRWFMRNEDISFFFLSQLILPPVVLALPFLVLYKELALLDTRDRAHPALHADGAADRHLDHARPVRLDSRSSSTRRRWSTACRSGAPSCRIILPIALPGMVAAFILSLVLCWNEYFFAALLTGSDAKTIPVMVASQTGSQGINWWSMAALSTAAIAPLAIIGVLLERYIIKGLSAGAVK